MRGEPRSSRGLQRLKFPGVAQKDSESLKKPLAFCDEHLRPVLLVKIVGDGFGTGDRERLDTLSLHRDHVFQILQSAFDQ
jgi:hypothetical protein